MQISGYCSRASTSAAVTEAKSRFGGGSAAPRSSADEKKEEDKKTLASPLLMLSVSRTRHYNSATVYPFMRRWNFNLIIIIIWNGVEKEVGDTRPVHGGFLGWKFIKRILIGGRNVADAVAASVGASVLRRPLMVGELELCGEELP